MITDLLAVIVPVVAAAVFPKKNGYPKKLLVVTCLVVTLAICVTPTESANEPDLLNVAWRRIIIKLKNTKNILLEKRKEFYEFDFHYRYGRSKWLPKVSFVALHNRTYKGLRHGMSREKFENLAPKLYVTFMRYKMVWERLRKVNVSHLDLYEYKIRRKPFFYSVVKEITFLLTEIQDAMDVALITYPSIDNTTLHLSDIKIAEVDTALCLSQDAKAIRAYGIMLVKWYWEMRCPDKSTPKRIEKCKRYEDHIYRKNLKKKNKYIISE